MWVPSSLFHLPPLLRLLPMPLPRPSSADAAASRSAPRRRPHRPPATPGMPPSCLVHLILLATLSLLLAQTLASSSPAAAIAAAASAAGAESGNPCAAAAVADGDGDVLLCSVRCFRPDPVYGADGVTYWCGCPEAACAGVTHRGYCKVGAGSAPVSGQALLLVHIVWLFVLGAAVLLGFL